MLIKKRQDYAEHRCVLGLSEKKESDFNAGKEVEVTEDEFNQVKNYEWCEEVVPKKSKKNKEGDNIDGN